MAFLDGQSLGQKLKATPTRRLPAPEVEHVIVSCLEALIYAHALVVDDHAVEGVVHRDIKPDNIMLCRSGQVQLVDFGIAKIVDLERTIQTATMIAGSPAYMAPEAHDGQVGPSCDLWSLAVVLFQCIMGELPFPGLRDLFGSAPVRALQLQPEDVATHGHLVDVVARALNKDRSKRYATAVDMLAAVKTA
mmetsp:Transcript_57178/g.134578  ORF Transcript_57178/g.134578 Transcript_57178/m.134578 type:complete len:191 (-) Transcript_57178:18-590(-)